MDNLGITLFGRCASIQINNRVFDMDSFDFEFTIDNQVGKTAVETVPTSSADITLWDLNDVSISQFKPGTVIRVAAGYAGDEDTIFLGKIKSATPGRSNADVSLTLLAADILTNLVESKKFTVTYPRGTKFTDMVSNLLERCGTRAGILVDPGVTTVTDFSVEGTGADCMTQVLQEVNGLRQKAGLEGKWQLYSVNELTYFVGPEHREAVVSYLSADTGLLEISRNEKSNVVATTPVDDIGAALDGDIDNTEPKVTYTLICLLQNKIRLGSIVRIESTPYTGNGKVLKYTHTSNGDEFCTKFEVEPV